MVYRTDGGKGKWHAVEQLAGERIMYWKMRMVNSNGNLSKAQYIRFTEKGISDEHILAKYQDLTPERLEMVK